MRDLWTRVWTWLRSLAVQPYPYPEPEPFTGAVRLHIWVADRDCPLRSALREDVTLPEGFTWRMALWATLDVPVVGGDLYMREHIRKLHPWAMIMVRVDQGGTIPLEYFGPVKECEGVMKVRCVPKEI